MPITYPSVPRIHTSADTIEMSQISQGLSPLLLSPTSSPAHNPIDTTWEAALRHTGLDMPDSDSSTAMMSGALSLLDERPAITTTHGKQKQKPLVAPSKKTAVSHPTRTLFGLAAIVGLGTALGVTQSAAQEKQEKTDARLKKVRTSLASLSDDMIRLDGMDDTLDRIRAELRNLKRF